MNYQEDIKALELAIKQAQQTITEIEEKIKEESAYFSSDDLWTRERSDKKAIELDGRVMINGKKKTRYLGIFSYDIFGGRDEALQFANYVAKYVQRFLDEKRKYEWCNNAKS